MSFLELIRRKKRKQHNYLTSVLSGNLFVLKWKNEYKTFVDKSIKLLNKLSNDFKNLGSLYS